MTPAESAEKSNPLLPHGLLKQHRCLAIFLAAGIGLLVFHPLLLRAAYGMLVVDQPTENCRYAVIATPTPECFDAVAEMVANATVETVLVVDKKPRRTVRVGAFPSKETSWTRADRREFPRPYPRASRLKPSHHIRCFASLTPCWQAKRSPGPRWSAPQR